MLTSKQRAALRGMANSIEPIVHIGKDGISDALIKQCDDALTARELIKLSVLETAGASAREFADRLAPELKLDVVQVIGRKIVLYRRNKKEPKIKI